jgi:hypothetical protein
MTEVADGSQVAMLAQQQPVSSVLDNGRPEGLVETVQQQGSSVNLLLDSSLGKKNLHMKGGEAEEMGAAAEQLTGMVETKSQPVLLEGIDNTAAVNQEVVNGGDTQKPKADDDPGVSPQESIEVNKEGDTFMEETPLEMKELETEKMNMKESEVVEQNMCMVKVDKACNDDESINVHKTQGEEEEQGKVQERGPPVSVGRGGGKRAGVVTPSVPAPRPRNKCALRGPRHLHTRDAGATLPSGIDVCTGRLKSLLRACLGFLCGDQVPMFIPQ